MKTSQTILSAVIFAGLLSASSFAQIVVSPLAAARFDAPAPAKVVSPVDLPRSFMREIVKVTLTVDAAGQPHDIKVVSTKDQAVTKSLVAAVSKWQFTPARENGVAVSCKVMLPLELVGA